MSGVKAVLITLTITISCVLVGAVSRSTGAILFAAAVIGTSGWAALDSSRLKVYEYKSPIAASPFVLFTACLGLWIAVFPTYLVVRNKVRMAALPKAVNPHARRALYLCIAVWCVIAMAIVASFVMGLMLAHVVGPTNTSRL